MLSRILLAEGDHNIQQIVEQTLSAEQVETVCAGDGLAALCLLNETSPDVLIADIGLPDKSGYDLCRYVREEPEFRSMPVVLLDNHFDSFNQSLASNVGADAYLSKPFEPSELAEIVRKLIESRKETGDERSASAVVPALHHQSPLFEAYGSAEPRAAHNGDEILTARRSSNRQTMTNSLPETVTPHSRKGNYFLLCAVLVGAILAGIGLAILERAQRSNHARQSSASEPAKNDPAKNEAAEDEASAVEGQRFAAASQEEAASKIDAGIATPSEVTDALTPVSHDEVAEAAQTSAPASAIRASEEPKAETRQEPETRREAVRKDSPTVALRNNSQGVSDDQRNISMTRPRIVRAGRSNTISGHLKRSGQEMKKAGSHFGSGAKHFGESGGQAAGWAGKKVGRGAKAIGRAFKKIF
jgi:twitching motility two-component system response regulator PilH